MTASSAARRRLLEASQAHVQEASAEVLALAKEIVGLSSPEREALASEVARMGERLQQYAAGDLARLDAELRLQASPGRSRVQLRVAGQELSLLATSLAQVGLSLDRASLKVRAQGPAVLGGDPRAFRLFTQGVEVGDRGFVLSSLARQLLQLGDEQLRFLRTLLDQGPAPRRSPRAPKARRKAPPPREEVWGGLESEDLVRRDPRKVQQIQARRTGPKKIIKFDPED